MRDNFYKISEVRKILNLSLNSVKTLVRLNRLQRGEQGYLKSDVDEFKLTHPGFYVYPSSKGFIKQLIQYEEDRWVRNYRCKQK